VNFVFLKKVLSAKIFSNEMLTVALSAHFQHVGSVLLKLVGPLSTAAPVWTIMAASKEIKQVVDGTAGGKSPILTSKHGAYDHFTPKEKVQMEEWADNLELWTPPCSSATP